MGHIATQPVTPRTFSRMHVMIISVVLAVMAALLASRRGTLAGILIAPLVGWLVFASIHNAELVNRDT